MSRKLALFAAAAFGLGLVTAPLLVAADKPADAVAQAQPDADGFVSLFNGKDLTGWRGMEGYWSVKDGAICGFQTKEKSKQTFLIWEGGNVTDFELRLKFKFAPVDGKVGGNSGIQFRSKVTDEKNFVVGGYQADFDSGNQYTGIIYDEKGIAGGRGIMSKRGEKTTYGADFTDPKKQKPTTEKLEKDDKQLKESIKVGDWNDAVLTVKGNHVVFKINGNTTTEVIDDSPKALKEGVLAFQLHAGHTMDIQFKDVRLKKL
ncbi:MAG TPA: DUF1080 domain-containing protein [Tepidisphaeraceae bacterium]|nr:DUF1080 domain-containing protein [Tepidisphaeraceae bacterium]